MPEQIIGSPDQRMLWIGNEGQIGISGTVNLGLGSIVIGSVSAHVDSIYVQSGANLTGSMYQWEDVPTAVIYNNPAWTFIYTGSMITRVVEFIGVGSYVQDLTYDIGSAITNVGSWY